MTARSPARNVATVAIAVVAALCLGGCAAPLESWNHQHWPPAAGDDCPPPYGVRRGPDAYDAAHGAPYHCESGPRLDDPTYVDVDALETSSP